MSRKRKKRIYDGPLSEPLPALPTLLDEDFEEMKRAHDGELRKRIGLLFDFYSVDCRGSHAWRDLAFELMSAHVPGFQYKQAASDGERLLQIVFDIEYLVRKHGISLKQASRVLAEIESSLGDGEAIRSIYREGKKHPANAALIRMLEKVATELGDQQLVHALEGSVVPALRELKDIAPLGPGRPPKK